MAFRRPSHPALRCCHKEPESQEQVLQPGMCLRGSEAPALLSCLFVPPLIRSAICFLKGLAGKRCPCCSGHSSTLRAGVLRLGLFPQPACQPAGGSAACQEGLGACAPSSRCPSFGGTLLGLGSHTIQFSHLKSETQALSVGVVYLSPQPISEPSQHPGKKARQQSLAFATCPETIANLPPVCAAPVWAFCIWLLAFRVKFPRLTHVVVCRCFAPFHGRNAGALPALAGWQRWFALQRSAANW